MTTLAKTSIYTALGGNVIVALIKLVAFAVSGSSAMLVEAIHSLVDTLNQLLLLFGLYRGARPPDARHPFGYGLEAYFWTFVVSLLIFLLGGVASIYGGVQKLLHPAPIEHVTLTLSVLLACGIFEVADLVIAVRVSDAGRPAASRKHYPKISVRQAIRLSADPGVFEVLAEDVASVVGLAFAALGVVGAAWLGWPFADGLAAVAIGVLLVVVAIVLVRETRSLLTAEAASPSLLAEVDAVLFRDTRVSAVCEVLSMTLGPQEVLMVITLEFVETFSRPQLEAAIDDLTARLKALDPRITRLFLRPGRALRGASLAAGGALGAP